MTRWANQEAMWEKVRAEQGVSFITVMMMTLMAGTLGVSALTMTAMDNSTAGALRMVEEGVDAAESCVGMGVRVIKEAADDGQVPLSLVAPNGPVPAANQAILGQEINAIFNSPDVAWGPGAVPNLVMNVNNYVVNGDIDRQYVKYRAGMAGSSDGGQDVSLDIFYRIDCQAVNAATGATSHVIAEYQCLLKGDTCLYQFRK